jgi:HEAT repeat protein
MRRCALLTSIAVFLACFLPAVADDAPKASSGTASAPDTAERGDAASRPPPDPEMDLLRRKIMYGQATLAEVRKALTDPDIGALTNTVHGLYSMRAHRGVYRLIYELWALRETDYPELQWRQFAKPPVRLALASTLIRIQPYDNGEYVNYLREHRYDEHEFHRAQVVIGLAFKADPADIPYVYEMAAGDNVFVAQSAITALGVMNVPPAKDALIRLLKERANDPRVQITKEVLKRAYDWRGESAPPEAATAKRERPGDTK